MKSRVVLFALPFVWGLGAGCTEPPSSQGSDGGPVGSDAAAATEEASPAAADFPCGLRPCPGDQVCCIDPVTQIPLCLVRSACYGIALSCLTTAMCAPGESCCASVRGASFDVACNSHCTGQGNFQLCALDSECPTGEICSMGAYIRVCAVPFDAATGPRGVGGD